MSDNVVLNPGSGGAIIRTDDFGGVQLPTTKIILGVDGADDGFVANSNPLPVYEKNTKSPQQSYLTSISVAAGGQVTLDSISVSNTKTGKLLGLVISSSLGFKAALQLLNNGVPTTNKIVWFTHSGHVSWNSPARDFYTVVGNNDPGVNGFRVVFTNLDVTISADCFVTFLWDEE